MHEIIIPANIKPGDILTLKIKFSQADKVDAKLFIQEVPFAESLTLKEISDLIIEKLPIRKETFFSKNRCRNVVWARFAFYYIASECYDNSVSEIGRFLKLHHTAIIYGVKKWIEKSGLGNRDPLVEKYTNLLKPQFNI